MVRVKKGKIVRAKYISIGRVPESHSGFVFPSRESMSLGRVAVERDPGRVPPSLPCRGWRRPGGECAHSAGWGGYHMVVMVRGGDRVEQRIAMSRPQKE
jgi:hypothetical protein